MTGCCSLNDLKQSREMPDYSKMTTFMTMAEQVIDLISKGEKPADSPLDERVIVRWLRQSAQRRIGGSIAAVWANGERVTDHNYIATFNDVEVKVDEATKDNYCDLPYFGHIFLFNNAHIQRVAPKKVSGGYGAAMIPISPHEMDIYGPLDAGYLEGQWSYEPDRFKIRFHKRMGKTLKEVGINHVQIKALSVDPNSVGDNDPIPVSQELEMDIIMDVVNIFGQGQEIEADMLTNANPNVSKVKPQTAQR